ncbi:MAG: M48 family metallopeptidase [Myxococcales bacterium]|nr:M48 family metallopeptidase [Myxococcales bacterium]
MELPGHAMHPTLDRGRQSGVLHTSILAIRFVSEGVTRELPLDGLTIKLAGAGERLVYFQHPNHPQWTLYTDQHSVLADPQLASSPALVAQIAAIRKRKRRGPLLAVAALVVLIALVVAAWQAKSLVALHMAEQVPVQWETKLGDVVFAQYSFTHPPLADVALQKAVERFAGHLTVAIDDLRYPLQFHVVADSKLNAFALPGGHVVLNSQVILEAESAGEVLGVLGHEVAHVTQRHGIVSLLDAIGGFVFFQLLIGDLTGVLAVMQDLGPQLLAQSYSRDHERQADDVGFNYLLTANIDPQGLPRFLVRAEQKSSGGPFAKVQEELSFLSTHPATAERVAHLRGRIDAGGKRAYKDLTSEFAQLQTLLRAALASGKTVESGAKTVSPNGKNTDAAAPSSPVTATE